MIRVKVDTKPVERLLEGFPKIANAEMNKAFKVAGGIFYRQLAKEVRSKLKIKKGASRGRGRGAAISIPGKIRTLGFTGKLSGRRQLQGKTLSLYTRNPVMLSHIFGATITPRRGRFLRIRVVSRAAARLSPLKHKLPFFFLVRRVRIPKRVEFFGTWSAVQPQISERLNRAIERIVHRAMRKRGIAPEAAGGGDAGA